MEQQALAPAVDNHKQRISQRLLRSAANDNLPLTIQHDRIYILPTTRGLAFVCVLAIMLMASINYGLNLGYALCFILVGLFSSCLLATYKNLVQIRFAAATADDTFEGTALTYRVNVSEERNSHRSSISVSSLHTSDTFDLKANSNTSATLTSKDPVRGVHTLGRLTLSSDFPLGLWRGWGYVHTPVLAFVYPTPESPTPEYAGTFEVGGKQRQGEHEYTGLKNYENTDSPSRIAWKRVASGTGWYSKQFEAEVQQSDVTISWQDTPIQMTDEQRLSRMCGWVLQAMEDNISYEFELPATKYSRASGREHSKRCLRALAKYKSAHKE